MSGHFFAFKNRERISETKKTSLRESLSIKKSNLINNTENNSNIEHVQISSNELNEIKKQIRWMFRNNTSQCAKKQQRYKN